MFDDSNTSAVGIVATFVGIADISAAESVVPVASYIVAGLSAFDVVESDDDSFPLVDSGVAFASVSLVGFETVAFWTLSTSLKNQLYSY